MKQRFCKYIPCGQPIPDSRNMNSDYCHQGCQKAYKAIAAAEDYKKKGEELELLRNDSIVHAIYEKYQSDNYIPAQHVIEKEFNWSIHSGEVIIHGIIAKKLIRYAYTLFQNQTIFIWKL